MQDRLQFSRKIGRDELQCSGNHQTLRKKSRSRLVHCQTVVEMRQLCHILFSGMRHAQLAECDGLHVLRTRAYCSCAGWTRCARRCQGRPIRGRHELANHSTAFIPRINTPGLRNKSLQVNREKFGILPVASLQITGFLRTHLTSNMVWFLSPSVI